MNQAYIQVSTIIRDYLKLLFTKTQKELEPRLPEVFHRFGRFAGSFENSSSSSSGGPSSIIFNGGDQDEDEGRCDENQKNAKKKSQKKMITDAVQRVLRSWQDSVLFPPNFLKGLQATFQFASDHGSDSEKIIEEYLTCPRLLQKVKEWNSVDHFSQLEKECRMRGLRFVVNNAKSNSKSLGAANAKNHYSPDEKIEFLVITIS